MIWPRGYRKKGRAVLFWPFRKNNKPLSISGMCV
nr:MAG TPA: hypothetical protein [Caudoviricetes sp.]